MSKDNVSQTSYFYAPTACASIYPFVSHIFGLGLVEYPRAMNGTRQLISDRFYRISDDYDHLYDSIRHIVTTLMPQCNGKLFFYAFRYAWPDGW